MSKHCFVFVTIRQSITDFNFQSITIIEYHTQKLVFLCDICTSMADILLENLVTLIHLRIYFNKYILLDHPCLKDFIIKKKNRQSISNAHLQ
jgi:hypothetical protein